MERTRDSRLCDARQRQYGKPYVYFARALQTKGFAIAIYNEEGTLCGVREAGINATYEYMKQPDWFALFLAII